MPGRLKSTYRHVQWAPGLVLNRPAAQLNPGEASIARNVDLRRNTVKRRDGWISVGTLPSGANDVTGLHAYYFQTTKQLIAVAGQYVMRSTGADFTTIVNNFVAIDQVPARPTFQTLNNKLYIAYTKGSGDTANQIASWDGTTFTQIVTGSPVSSLVIDYGNALWAAGDTSVPNRIRWTGLIGTSGTDTWPAANYIDLHPGDGDRITGVTRVQNILVVLKERSVHRITGNPPDDAALATGSLTAVKLDGQPGCVAPRSVATNQQLCVWLNRRGVYGYNGSSVEELTALVRPFFDDADPVNIKYAVGKFVSPHEYIVTFPKTGGGKKTLYITFRPETFQEWSGLNIESVTTFDFTQYGNQAVYGFTGGAVGRRAEGASDGGAAIPWEYQSGMLPLGPPTEKKTTRPGYLRGKANSENVTIKLMRDFSESGGRKTLSMGNSNSEIHTARFRALSVARGLEINLSGLGTGVAPEVSEVVLEFYRRAS